MKCQKCPKPATFHITDIERGKPRKFHFCGEHARRHITVPGESFEAAEPIEVANTPDHAPESFDPNLAVGSASNEVAKILAGFRAGEVS